MYRSSANKVSPCCPPSSSSKWNTGRSPLCQPEQTWGANSALTERVALPCSCLSPRYYLPVLEWAQLLTGHQTRWPHVVTGKTLGTQSQKRLPLSCGSSLRPHSKVSLLWLCWNISCSRKLRGNFCNLMAWKCSYQVNYFQLRNKTCLSKPSIPHQYIDTIPV